MRRRTGRDPENATEHRGRTGPAPLPLRVVHGAVFLGFAALSVLGTWTELAQWARAWSSPWHAGTPPFWPAVAGAVLAVGGAAVLLFRLLRRQVVSVFVSVAILAGFIVSLSVNAANPSRRTVEGANGALLASGRALQAAMGASLQKQAEVPNDLAEWELRLAQVGDAKGQGGSAYRDRGFRLAPLRVHFLSEDAWTPEGQAPGTIGVWISRDQVEFTLRLLGIDGQGQPALLNDDRGAPITLRGVFNPDIGAGRAP